MSVEQMMVVYDVSLDIISVEIGSIILVTIVPVMYIVKLAPKDVLTFGD